jgi:hypothetical protein
MAAPAQRNDAQMPTDAFRDLVGWFPRSGKAAEGLWGVSSEQAGFVSAQADSRAKVQHQGIVANADKLAQRQQKVDVIFMQAGDPFLAR